MTYSLVIPPPLICAMYRIRERTGVSIRQQIISAIEHHVQQQEDEADVIAS